MDAVTSSRSRGVRRFGSSHGRRAAFSILLSKKSFQASLFMKVLYITKLLWSRIIFGLNCTVFWIRIAGELHSPRDDDRDVVRGGSTLSESRHRIMDRFDD